MSGARNQKEEALFVPIATSGHARTFDHRDYIVLGIGRFKRTEIPMQMVEGDIDNAGHEAMVGPTQFSYVLPSCKIRE